MCVYLKYPRLIIFSITYYTTGMYKNSFYMSSQAMDYVILEALIQKGSLSYGGIVTVNTGGQLARDRGTCIGKDKKPVIGCKVNFHNLKSTLNFYNIYTHTYTLHTCTTYTHPT